MDEQRLHELISSPIDRSSDQYSILAGVTHLSDIEVKELEKSYYSCTYSTTNRQQQITLETFSNLLSPVLPPILIPGFFDAFDENRDGCIDFKEFVCGISAACRGPYFERYKFLFRVFDRDHHGRLDRSDIVHMSSCLIDVAQFVYVLTIHMNDSPDVYADDILQNNGNNKTNQIKYFQQEDFLNWCATDALIQQLIELIFQICHVVLGLRPSTKQEEITIVKQFLRREQYPFVEAQSGVSSKAYHWINSNRSTSKPGSSWYLISRDWWLRWESPASISSTEPIVTTIQKKNSLTKLNKLTSGPDNNLFSSSGTSNSIPANTQRHYLTCSYFVSPYQTVRSLAEELSKKFGKPLDELRIWIRYSENDLRQIDFESSDDLECQSAGLEQNIDILFETRNTDLTWPEELYTLATRSKNVAVQSLASNNNNNNNSTSNAEEEGRGLIGLSNLGNTCFLNAAVQCLSHSFPLTFYFLHKYHLFEINKDNPIGMQGNIALRYGQLITKLWSTVRGPLAPFELRDSVAKFGSSRFTDFQQHDSQEFLSFLLDGLHEDLNRVHNKPYVELKDSDNRPDETVAYEHWANHLARNTSIIVDLFHGLLRSQVKCSVCELKSVRFDPFNILSLPLPMDTSIYIEIKLIRLDGSRPTRYGIRLDGDLAVSQLKSQLSTLSSLSIEQIGFFEVTTSSCLRRYPLMDNDQTKIKQLNLRELLAYELPIVIKPPEPSDDETPSTTRSLSYIKAMHRRLERQERYVSPMTRHKIMFFGQPILIPCGSENKLTNEDIYKIDVEIHPSVKSSRSPNNDSMNLDDLSSIVRLEDCLESFIKWENLDHKEMFNCKTCQKLQPADKKLDIWKLPPCLIFHIKRFQLSNTRWIKSSRPVRFPIKSFHPSKYLAQRSPTNTSIQFLPTEGDISTSSSSSLSSITTTTTTTPEAVSSSSIDNMLILSPSRLVNGNHNYIKRDNEPHKGLPPPEKIHETIKKKKKKRFGQRRKRIDIETSDSTLQPPKFSQMADRTLSFGDNSFDADNAAYNLYALVCHYGVIGGGHYVAYVKNHTNQQWYCFNDSSCKPVSESVLEQCSSSAYLLFYERESLDHRCYMPNVEGKKQVASEFQLPGDDRWCSIM
ncbi:unnamed protein product [Rotaria socialis]|uniref:ubiquitinyl hydrolase 1 n=1 Tax=Rotaria socialis TaxID=392032 RepID=A0A821M289_9BILA|nr:unnamed protein product [Rotaria socialis]